MKVPLLDLAPQHQPLRKDLLKAMERVLDSEQFILGAEVEKIEQEIAAYCATRFAVGLSSGTDALLVALMAIGIQPGDEVITTPYSFFATAGCIARLGAKPVFVDIDPVTFNLDPKQIPRALTAKTKAVIPVHLFGQCADMGSIAKTLEGRKVAVIEDAAQAIGSADPAGRKAGGLGDIGCFSFFPTKNLGAFGDAGMVTTNNETLAKTVRTLRVHGSSPKYYHRLIGGNFRLDALQAALISVKLPSLDRWTQQRRTNAKRYEQLFEKTDLLATKRVRLPKAVYPHCYNQFIIRAEQRDGLLEHLKKADIGSEIYYPLPLHLQECFSYLGYRKGDFPEAERAAQETLALPVYPGLSEQQQVWVVDTIQKFYSRTASPTRSATS